MNRQMVEVSFRADDGRKSQSPVNYISLQMVRGRGVKVKRFVSNGCFDRLYGTKSPVNCFSKSSSFQLFVWKFIDISHKASDDKLLTNRLSASLSPFESQNA